MQIAVVGSGISGLVAAWCLSQRHDVTLFERESRVGGHTHTIEVPLPDGRTQPVDTGWIVYNGLNYPNLSAMFEALGIATRPTRMSFGVSLGDGAYEYMGSDRLWTVFAQPSNLLRPAHLRMLVDILRLNARCRALLRSGELPAGSLGDFLHGLRLSPDVAARYLLPMAGLIWSCSPRKAMEYPAADFMRFFDSHSLFTATQQPVWRTVVGGSHRYLAPLMAAFRGRLCLRTPVQAIRRSGDQLRLHTSEGDARFDALVCATHSDQALRLLGADADPTEREVLSGIPYNASRCVLHTDERFLPRRRAAWASWTYLNDAVDGRGRCDFEREVHDRPISGSYWMNGLQGIPGPVNYIVTLNPTREVAPEKVLLDTVYEHPHYGPRSVESHRDLHRIQGRGGLWFAGAWTQYGFHEDGLTSGLRAVRGVDASCLPAWAVL
ncbi:MAG: FAD-dependent oxidoreductase [Panacagrimonas sp.]|jgi:predicted NAD/FAD-binding protein|nr:FAD-dependent oxidoreductase [Panacagrimonas sp.]MCC2656565.1 FAD-dependent oxidoreductase [Panacagrimonas sp.]